MKPPPSAAPLRAFHGRPRRRFGQHFLVQPETARRIVGLAELDGCKPVLEIGPGRGALTEFLAEGAGELWVIEVDRDLSARLHERFATNPRVHVIEGDVLEVDIEVLLRPSAPVIAVANLPYNISTPLLMRLLQPPELFSRLVLMVQREVAERLVASPGTKAYGALSVMVQLVARTRIALRVRPGAFSPRPKVDSAVVMIEPIRPSPLKPTDLDRVRQVVRVAFARRRKQLGNAIAPLCEDPSGILGALAIDPQRRPETLSPHDFVRLAKALVQPRSPGTSPVAKRQRSGRR